MGRYDYQYDHAAEPMEPDPGQTIEHAIGDVIIEFEELDDAIASAISGILNRGDDMGRIVTSQLSFRNKVDMFGALVRHDRPNSILAKLIDELCAGCLSIEEERNKIVHSKWTHDFRVPGIQRSKFTARVKHGLKETKETWHPGHFVSVWVHCGYLAHEIDSWMWGVWTPVRPERPGGCRPASSRAIRTRNRLINHRDMRPSHDFRAQEPIKPITGELLICSCINATAKHRHPILFQ